MRFVEPSLLIWCSLAIVPIVLFLVRPRPKTVRTTTLAFFKSLSRAFQENAWLRRLKQLLSLLLSILVILALSFALSRLVVSPSAEALKSVVIVVDRSASMQVTAGEEGSALSRGLAAVRTRLAGLPSGVNLMVVAYDRRPELLQSRTQDRRAVERALAQIEARPLAGDAGRALRLAGDLAAMDKPAVVWHVSDHLPREKEKSSATGDKENDEPAGDDSSAKPQAADVASQLPDGVTLEAMIVGHRKTMNAGITALELRHAAYSRVLHEAFVQVEASTDEPRDAELEVSVDGRLIDLRKLTLQKDRRERLLLPLEADPEREGLLAVRIKMADDVLPTDDAAYARIPRARPLKVLWISKERDPFTELALTSLGQDYDVSVGGPDVWPPKDDTAARPNVVIFDGWTPEKWPTDVPAVVVNPPATFGGVRVARLKEPGTFHERIRPTQLGHPLLYGVANDRVSLVQTMVFESGSLLEPLWVSPTAEPLLAAGTIQGQKLVVIGFEPAKSENLPLMASYPLLLGNAVNWAGRDALEDEAGHNHRTGDLVEVGDQREVRWLPSPAEVKTTKNEAPAEPAVAKDDVVTAAGRWYELDRVGAWRTQSGEHGTASLLAGGESRLATDDDTVAAASSLGFLRLDGDLTMPMLWFVLALLVAESWLFHRKAVY